MSRMVLWSKPLLIAGCFLLISCYSSSASWKARILLSEGRRSSETLISLLLRPHQAQVSRLPASGTTDASLRFTIASLVGLCRKRPVPFILLLPSQGQLLHSKDGHAL